MVAPVLNTSTGEAEQADRSMFEDGLVYIIVPGHAGLHSEILSLQENENFGVFQKGD